jgi:integrase
MAKLTAKAIENIKAGPVRREIPDAGCAGLYLISQSSGARSWAVRYRYNGKPTKLTIGQWPVMTLAAAREAATAAQRALEQGNNPAKAKADAKIKADAAKADTLTAVCENYLRREGGKLRTLDQRVSILRRLIYPRLGSLPIGSIKRSDIVTTLDYVEDHTGPRAADVCLAILRKIMSWHAARTDDFVPPFVRGMNRQVAAEHRRDRILSDDEIKSVWASTADESPFSVLVRVLLLTGARRCEISNIRHEEIEDDVWTLPASRSKSRAAVIRPLSQAALAMLDGLPRIDDCGFLFTLNGRTPLAQFSGPKKRLDDASGVTNWQLHDLRRTARSLLSRCKGVTVDHAERVLGHAIPGIRATYDKHDYAEEMRFAVEALAAEIDRIVHPPEGAVIPMRRR